ncbi:MAG: arginine--tRNA ligase [Candidatus Latescibacterota bacterium]|jgi:arginyl-tRNA synthetase
MNPFVDEIVQTTTAVTSLDEAVVRELVAVPPDDKLGDYALPCFTLAKQLRKNPAQIAGDIVGQLTARIADSERLESVSAAGPYVNFVLSRPVFIGYVLERIATEGETYGSDGQGQGKRLTLDFSAPNSAKPFSIAHLRSTAIGNSIYRIHQFLGWNCIGINHLGDYGANFGQLLAAYEMWGDEAQVKSNPVPELQALYVRFNEEQEKDPTLRNAARECVRLLAEGDEEMLRLWTWFTAESTKEAERIYRILGVHFDETKGESAFADKLDEVIELFSAKGLAEESDGALIVHLQENGADQQEEGKPSIAPLMLRTSRGTSTYHSRDVAALLYRWNRYAFDKMVYVTDSRQKLHFQQLFLGMERAGMDWIDRCEHAPFGLMSFKGKTFSTRKGFSVILEDVLEQAIALTAAIIAEKNPDLAGSAEVARQVGISAVVFADVNNRRTRDISFDLEDVLNFDGETGPYVQYTHARFCSILRKYGRDVDLSADVSRLGVHGEMRLSRKLAEFPQVLDNATRDNEPSFVASYVLDLATAANKFYNEVPVLAGDDAVLIAARVRLVDAARRVLSTGLYLLGMSAPEEM